MNATDKLLSQLGKCANAQPMFLNFFMPKDTNDIGEILLRNLKAGTFQHQFILFEFEHNEFPNYLDIAVNDKFTLFMPSVGELWNGKEPLVCEPISRETFKRHLIDMLCGGEIYTKPNQSTSLDNANQMIDDFFDEFTRKDTHWKVSWVKPDFLYTVEQACDSGHIYQGYFENFGRDMAMAIQADNQIYLLLVNGYA